MPRPTGLHRFSEDEARTWARFSVSVRNAMRIRALVGCLLLAFHAAYGSDVTAGPNGDQPRLNSKFPAATRVAIVGGQWHINGQLTYPAAQAEGLLLNVRMVNATFEDAYRPAFDAEANTDAFIAQVPDYIAHGVLAFTLNLQGGTPGYEGALNSAFNPDASLRPRRILSLKRYGKPVVCNEDQKTGELGAKAAELCVANGASWGLMVEKVNQHFPFSFRGAADDPIVYAKLKQLAQVPAASKYSHNGSSKRPPRLPTTSRRPSCAGS